MNSDDSSAGIAIIGMAGRFPQAATLDAFWNLLREGREAVTGFSAAEAQWLPHEHAPARDDPNLVCARAALDRPEWFDAAFFRLQPREAAMMDPQQRVLLECAWEALEDAGCDPDTFAGPIGVFAGAGLNSYLLHNLLTHQNLIADYGLFAVLTMNDKDYLATRISHKLNLRGPSINVQTACSTSLVAVSLACQSLQDYQCDVALAGGVSISFPVNRGHLYAAGGIMSQDGHCRSFDSQASGTVAGSGAGLVVLKRLGDALTAGDRICAVIKGHAVNNDGALKPGFTAPSIAGQAECIASALAMAGGPDRPVSYIEAHGTGTPLGDPIEIAALTRAFRAGSAAGVASCALGALKTNFGHLDAAAGIAGLIKVTLALEHGEIPPTLHFRRANPAIDFAGGPFFVNTRLLPWPRGATPRRAGVSAFGIGGTNAHVVLEEAPVRVRGAPARPPHLLVLSAPTRPALEAATENLASHLDRFLPRAGGGSAPAANRAGGAAAGPDLGEVAFTLQTGRKAFAHRRALVVWDRADAVAGLRARGGARLIDGRAEGPAAGVVFMFPGQGSQAVRMARELYDAEGGFRRDVNEACETIRPRLDRDLRSVLFPPRGGPLESSPDPAGAGGRLLAETRFAQPALFVIEYALARQWMRWGIQPAAMIGHSLGEYVAACLAGLFRLEDALALVAERGRLMQAQPPGAMLAVRLAEDQAMAWAQGDVALAAVNSPKACVLSGPLADVDRLQRELGEAGVPCKRLPTSHAFHSAMMAPVGPALADLVRCLPRSPPVLPWVSNVTGTWITPRQAMDPEYWSAQVCRPVRFAAGLGEILGAGPRLLLEVGPGRTLAQLARQHPGTAGVTIATSLRLDPGGPSDAVALRHALGQLWVAGARPDWRAGVHEGQPRSLVALPTYPFERTRCWIEPGAGWRADADSSGAGAAAGPSPAVVAPALPIAPERAPAAGGSTTLETVRLLFQELSGVDLAPATPGTTFNQLGFDSLFLTQACAALNRRFGAALPFQRLRDEWVTLAQVAAEIDRVTGGAAPGGAAVAPQPLPAAQELPLTEAQREIWMASQMGEGAAAAYHEAATVQLEGPLEVDVLRRAVRALVARHEALRTTFAAGGEVQRIAATGTVELAYYDLPADGRIPAEGRAEEAAAWVARECRRPFDLATGPLCRPVLVRLAPQQHLLSLIVHHLVCDGWSLGVLLREWAELYSAELAQRRPALRAAPSFADHARSHGAGPGDQKTAAAEAYWREHFADAVPVLDLPRDRPRADVRTFAGDSLGCTLSPPLTSALTRFCAERDCTVFTALLAVFAALLHRLSGQSDLVVGVPTAGQALAGQPDLVGHFANLVPVRSRLPEGQRFSSFLAELQRTLSRALAQGGFPFNRLLQQLKLARDSSRVALTPVLFNTAHQRGQVRFGAALATLTFQPKQDVNFDLSFHFAPVGEGYFFGCHFSTEAYERATVARWLGHYETMLRHLLAAPDLVVADVPWWTEPERHTLLVKWNETGLAYRRDACVHELFEEQVTRTPEAVAVVAGDLRLSYRELNRRAERLATRLRAAGVRPEVRVGILLARNEWLLVGVLAVLKAGGAYVPLDPADPGRRRTLLAEDTGMALALTEPALASLVPAGVKGLVVSEAGEAEAVPDVPEAGERASAEDLAYVIYTSGSTGQPKGVGVPHRAVAALVAWAGQFYRPEELAGVCFATSVCFDVSVFESLVPLCLGGTVIVAEHLLRLDRVPGRNEITLVSGVPSAVAELARSGAWPVSARSVNVAGEPCPQALVEELYALPPVQRVYDLYGPTETTVYSTGGLRERGGRDTIGRPLANEQAYILDARLQPVPIGVRGELCLGGDKLARGYLRRRELTEERFPAAPAFPGGRLYRTGDAARFLADGRIELLGRMDLQVKLRGYRLEPGEIEAVLRRHPAVREAVVMVRTRPDGGRQLCAYVVPAVAGTITAAELEDHARQWLPGPMVPTALLLLPRLPRTGSGKVDRGALPAPDSGPAESLRTAPRNHTEQALHEIWCAVLGLAPAVVGVHDNFFALGGHSLHAMKVLARLGALFEVEIPLRDFFAAPTLAGLAPKLEAALLEGVPVSAR